MSINITPVGVIESTIMYGIVHAIWLAIKWFAGRLKKEAKKAARRERNRIIHRHVKTGHEGRLKHCDDNDCTNLRSSAPPLTQAEQVPPELLEAELS